MTPARLQQLLQEGVTFHGAGQLDQAEKLYGQAREAEPTHFDVLHLSGTLALQRGRHADAVDWLGRALGLNPRSAVCAMRLGLAQAGLGHHTEAEKHLRDALRRQSGLTEAWDNLGLVLTAQGRLEEAIPCHERAVAQQPEFVPGWYHLGVALQYAGRLTESLAAQDRALRLAPQLAKLHYGRALALQQAHRLDEALAAFDATLVLDPGHLSARSHRLLLLNYSSDLTREQLFAEHQAYGALWAEPAAVFPALDLTPDRRLRVAFLSPDLRTHSVAYFLEPILRHLDRTHFDVLLYHDHHLVDEASRRLQAPGDAWRNFAGLSHDEVEPLIRADAPDLLIDLAGHTSLNRLPLFARRVAPVQISYLGYPNTTGLTAMDYRFTDEVADPAGEAEVWHTEQLVRLAPVAWTYLPPAASPPVAAAPPCVGNGYVTFGSFNNFSKVSEETLAAWALLLRAVPNSRLQLKIPGLGEPAVQTFVRERLRPLGLPDDRLKLLDRTPGVGGHLTLYHEVDIALDTFPYHGTTTTCEAMWMGVPVITLAGGQHAARVGASLLGAVGRTDWIARDWNGYVKLAAALADDPAELVSIRDRLRAELQHSPLFDYAGQAARFGMALRDCWQARCNLGPSVNVA